MAEVTYNSFAGEFQQTGDAAAAAAAANSLTPPAHHNFRGSGGWVSGANGSVQRDAGGNGWVSAGELARGAEGSIERTVRNSYGHPVTNRPCQGNDRLDIPGVAGVSLDLAAQLGYVTRNPDGTFSFSGEAGSDRAPQQQQQQQQQQPQGQPQAQRSGQPEQAPEGQPEGQQPAFRASEAAETAITALTQTCDAGTQIAALNAVVEHGGIDDGMIQKLAERSGKDPQQIRQDVTAAHQGFYDAVTSRMETQGVHDLDLFGDYVEGDFKLTGQMQKAVRDLMMTNDPSGFDGLVSGFVQSLDRIDPENVKDALKAAGVPFSIANNGNIVLDLPGHGQVAYGEAVKLGLIKVSRA